MTPSDRAEYKARRLFAALLRDKGDLEEIARTIEHNWVTNDREVWGIVARLFKIHISRQGLGCGPCPLYLHQIHKKPEKGWGGGGIT